MGRLLDRRHSRGGRLEYLVRWKGYGAHEDTWEPVDNLANAQKMIEAFEARHGNQTCVTERRGRRRR